MHHACKKWVHIEKILKKPNISFLIKDSELLEKTNEILDEISKVIKKGFESKPV